jgi:AhpD family alkylhydroperoxidase
MYRHLKLTLAAAVVSAVSFAQPSLAQENSAETARTSIEETLGFVPQFFDAIPDHALGALWTGMTELQMNPDTALSAKEKELVALGVAAQIPCQYCVYAHARFAMANGATEQEVREAIGMASLTRMGSTLLQGLETDFDQFKADIDRLVGN